VNEITAIAAGSGTPLWITPAYDAAGNTTTFPQTADPTQSLTATYDAWNRLSTVSDSLGTITSYSYDGRNRRIVAVTAATSEPGHFYYTAGWQNIEERVGSSTTADNQYVWGVRYIDELICRDDATPQRLYALQDANFNVTAMTNDSDVTATPSCSGSSMTPTVRTPCSAGHGHRPAMPTTGTTGSRGEGMTVSVDCTNFRYRDYGSIIGAWMTRDPAEYVDAANLYLAFARDRRHGWILLV